MMNVAVEYFAQLKEEAGVGSERITVDRLTHRDLYLELKRRHGFSVCASSIKVAVNDQYEEMDSDVIDGATVVFIPPVSGG